MMKTVKTYHIDQTWWYVRVYCKKWKWNILNTYMYIKFIMSKTCQLFTKNIQQVHVYMQWFIYYLVRLANRVALFPFCFICLLLTQGHTIQFVTKQGALHLHKSWYCVIVSLHNPFTRIATKSWASIWWVSEASYGTNYRRSLIIA